MTKITPEIVALIDDLVSQRIAEHNLPKPYVAPPEPVFERFEINVPDADNRPLVTDFDPLTGRANAVMSRETYTTEGDDEAALIREYRAKKGKHPARATDCRHG